MINPRFLQSHLTGIEIAFRHDLQTQSLAFNRTLLELKCAWSVGLGVSKPPSIAPYWN